MANLGGAKLTWLGHSTFLIATPEGKRILIDPWLANNPECPEELQNPGKLDAILITHAHFDHIGDLFDVADDAETIVGINETIGWIQSKGVAEDKLVGMNIGGTFEVAGVKAHMVQAIHSCGISDGDQTLYGGSAAGYVIEFANGFSLYHPGDTAVFGDMALIGKLLQPDVAILPIGDHFTMGPASAAEATRLLGVGTVIPCHFGAFPIFTGTVEEYRKEAGDVSGLEIVELEVGDTVG